MALGEVQVLAELCVCVEMSDRLGVVIQWATDIATFLTTAT